MSFQDEVGNREISNFLKAFISDYTLINKKCKDFVFRKLNFENINNNNNNLFEDNFDEILKERIKVWNARITERNIRWKRNDVTEFDYVIVRPEEIHYGDIKAFVNENPSVISFSYNPLLRHIS